MVELCAGVDDSHTAASAPVPTSDQVFVLQGSVPVRPGHADFDCSFLRTHNASELCRMRSRTSPGVPGLMHARGLCNASSDIIIFLKIPVTHAAIAVFSMTNDSRR